LSKGVPVTRATLSATATKPSPAFSRDSSHNALSSPPWPIFKSPHQIIRFPPHLDQNRRHRLPSRISRQHRQNAGTYCCELHLRLNSRFSTQNCTCPSHGSPGSDAVPTAGNSTRAPGLTTIAKQSHKTFRTKQKLAKAQKQNRPIPQWIRLRTGNTIRYEDHTTNTHARLVGRWGGEGDVGEGSRWHLLSVPCGPALPGSRTLHHPQTHGQDILTCLPQVQRQA
jgi:large subunit ribosomal protein L39e